MMLASCSLDTQQYADGYARVARGVRDGEMGCSIQWDDARQPIATRTYCVRTEDACAMPRPRLVMLVVGNAECAESAKNVNIIPGRLYV